MRASLTRRRGCSRSARWPGPRCSRRGAPWAACSPLRGERRRPDLMAVSWIAFHLTDRCQLDCQHCLRDPGLTPKDLPLSLIQKVLAEAHTLYGTAHVALTGGEPTLHPEFAAVVDAIVANDCGWHVVTNAKRFEHTLALLK